jgi:hypothetical protein
MHFSSFLCVLQASHLLHLIITIIFGEGLKFWSSHLHCFLQTPTVCGFAHYVKDQVSHLYIWKIKLQLRVRMTNSLWTCTLSQLAWRCPAVHSKSVWITSIFILFLQSLCSDCFNSDGIWNDMICHKKGKESIYYSPCVVLCSFPCYMHLKPWNMCDLVTWKQLIT